MVDREIGEPGFGQVRVTVEACGICHTDAGFVNDAFPGLRFPLTPGHEIAGRVEAIGEGVESWAPGDRVAVGWFGGHCGYCDPCRHGEFIHCRRAQVPGWTYPGGYAEAIIAPANALARIPEGLTPAEAAPMGCAGVSVFNPLRRHARPDDRVAIVGFGGLGHLGLQFAVQMGLRTAVVARGKEKEALAYKLGARHYIDSLSQDVGAELQKLGGAKVALATAANADTMTATIDGLQTGGVLVVLGAVPEPVQVSPFQVILQSRTVQGHGAGTAVEVEETMSFAALTGLRPLLEEVPLEEAQAGYERMLANKARFRVVLTTGL